MLLKTLAVFGTVCFATYLCYSLLVNSSIDTLENIMDNKLPVLAGCLAVSIAIVSLIVLLF